MCLKHETHTHTHTSNEGAWLCTREQDEQLYMTKTMDGARNALSIDTLSRIYMGHLPGKTIG